MVLGQLALWGTIQEGFYLSSSNASTEPLTIVRGFPVNIQFDIILKYSLGAFQLAWTVDGYTTSFAYAIPQWGLNISMVRTAPWNTQTSSLWILSPGSCADHSSVFIEPPVPASLVNDWTLATCANLLISPMHLCTLSHWNHCLRSDLSKHERLLSSYYTL